MRPGREYRRRDSPSVADKPAASAISLNPESRHVKRWPKARCAGRSEANISRSDRRRTSTELGVQELMQKTLDNYGAGILVQQVQMQKVDPPASDRLVRDVQAARADLRAAAERGADYANRVVPDAKGRAAQILQVAEGYKQQRWPRPRAQSALPQGLRRYKKAPDVTRQRIYLETMERISRVREADL